MESMLLELIFTACQTEMAKCLMGEGMQVKDSECCMKSEPQKAKYLDQIFNSSESSYHSQQGYSIKDKPCVTFIWTVPVAVNTTIF